MIKFNRASYNRVQNDSIELGIEYLSLVDLIFHLKLLAVTPDTASRIWRKFP